MTVSHSFIIRKIIPINGRFLKHTTSEMLGLNWKLTRKLSRFPVPDFLWKEFYLDQEINDRGILVDMQLADKAISLDAEAKEELTVEMKRLTGVENPNSVYQLLDWLETQGYKSDSLGKAQVPGTHQNYKRTCEIRASDAFAVV